MKKAILFTILGMCLAASAFAKEESSSVMVRTTSQATQAPLPIRDESATGSTVDPADTFGNTVDEMNKMVQRMNQWLQRNWPDSYANKGQLVFHPDLDLSETQTQYTIKMDLPGMKKEDIEIEVSDQVVTISGERKKEGEETTKDGIHRKERNFGAFQRAVTLPEPIKADQMTAEYVNGILSVKIPKLLPMAGEPKKIKVRIS